MVSPQYKHIRTRRSVTVEDAMADLTLIYTKTKNAKVTLDSLDTQELYKLKEAVDAAYKEKKKATKKVVPISEPGPNKAKVVLPLMKDRIAFAEKYAIDDVNLVNQAKQVKNSEACEAGFEYETLMAALFTATYAAKKKESLLEKFPLIGFAFKGITMERMAEDPVLRECVWIVRPDKDILLSEYNKIFKIPSRDDWIRYCELRVPGVGKPAGSSQTIGPDLSMWLREDVLLVVGSKISKTLYEYKPDEKKKTPSALLISHDILDKNDFSTDLENYGLTIKQAETLVGKGAEFNREVKRALFDHEKPLKVYIRVNSCFPYRPATTAPRKNSEKYLASVNPKPVVTERETDYNGVTYKYFEVRINLTSENYEQVGLFDVNKQVKDIMNEVFFEPYKKWIAKD